MADDIRKLKNRIRSVDSTAHLTRAMGLVASSKMRRAGLQMKAAGDYDRTFASALKTLLSTKECQRSVYARENGHPATLAVVIAGDRGMAGGYNANVFRLADSLQADEFFPIGRRACARYKAEGISSEHFNVEQAEKLVSVLCERFRRAEVGKILLVSTKYRSMMSQEAVVTRLLPLGSDDGNEKETAPLDALFEPDAVTVLEKAVPAYLCGVIMHAVRESFASETAARRTAMDNAGRNAQIMMDDLQVQYNRARQNAITQEITEIVAGSGH